jgi:hypothetical protein
MPAATTPTIAVSTAFFVAQQTRRGVCRSRHPGAVFRLSCGATCRAETR